MNRIKTMPRHRSSSRRRSALLFLAFLGPVTAFDATFSAPARAHEVPGDVTLQVYVRPLGERLSVLVRAPLESDAGRCRLPDSWSPGYLDLETRPRGPRVARRRDALDRARTSRALRGRAGACPAAPKIITDCSIDCPGTASSPDCGRVGRLAHSEGRSAWRTPCRSPWRPGRDARRAVRDRDRVGEVRARHSPSLRAPRSPRVTVLRFLPPGGAERAFEYAATPASCGSTRGGTRRPGVRRVGFLHILDGVDHLLFLFCLVIPFRRTRALPRHLVHGRALGDAHRLGLRARARRALVSPAHRDAHRRIDRVHGAREHHRRQPAAALAHHVRRSAWCTASASRSRCARRCSSPARTC